MVAGRSTERLAAYRNTTEEIAEFPRNKGRTDLSNLPMEYIGRIHDLIAQEIHSLSWPKIAHVKPFVVYTPEFEIPIRTTPRGVLRSCQVGPLEEILHEGRAHERGQRCKQLNIGGSGSTLNKEMPKAVNVYQIPD